MMEKIVGSRWTPPAIAGTAVLLSLIFSLILFRPVQTEFGANIDPDRLGDLSANIYAGRGFVYSTPSGFKPAFDRGPLYPSLLAAVYTLAGGRSFESVQVVQGLFHGLTCWILFLVALRLFSRKTALIAQAICAIHPMLIWYTARIWIETTHVLLVSTSALSLLSLFEKPGAWRAVRSAIALAATVLTKSVLLPFPLVAGMLLLKQGKKGALACAVFVLVFAALIAPWTIRNFKAGGSFVPVHTSAGLNMIQGNALADHWSEAPWSTVKLWSFGKAEMDSLLRPSGASADEPEGDRILIKASLAEILGRPLFGLKRVCMNALTFWCLSETPFKTLLLALMEIPLMILMIVFTRNFRTLPRTLPLVLLVWWFWAAHMFIVGWARYSLPVVPLCILFGVGYVSGELSRRFPHP